MLASLIIGYIDINPFDGTRHQDTIGLSDRLEKARASRTFGIIGPVERVIYYLLKGGA